MSTAQLQIRDAAGTVMLDLSSRITRKTQTLTRTTPTNASAPSEFIVLGAASLRDRFWVFLRFEKTLRTDGKEYAPVGCFEAFVCTRAEISASPFPTATKNWFLSNMPTDSTYLIIQDAREEYVGFNIANTCTIDVGMY